MLAEIGPWEIGGLVLLAIILFGAKKLPEIGKGLGKGLREFRDATKGLTDDERSSAENKPAVPPAKDETGTGGPTAGA
jgi:sec-independent protein translocase protein TatA